MSTGNVIASSVLGKLLSQLSESSAGTSFAIFLKDYVVEGAALTLDPSNLKKFTIGSSIICMGDEIYRAEEGDFRVSKASATYYVDFTAKGYVLGLTRPDDDYLPLWQITTKDDGTINVTTDLRGTVGGVQFDTEVVGLLTDDVVVDAAHILANAVTTSKIIDAAVTTAKIADNSITTAKIGNSQITTAKIADGSITLPKLAGGIIGSEQISDGIITNSKIADGSVTEAKIDPILMTTINGYSALYNFRDELIASRESYASLDARLDAIIASIPIGGGGGGPGGDFASWVTPEQYGAVGNGSADDTNAMLLAINASLASRKPLILGTATYRCSNTIIDFVSKSNFYMVGQGVESSRIIFANSDSTKCLMKMELCNNIVMRDFSVSTTNGVGIGLKLGRWNSAGTGNAKFNAVMNSQFRNLKFAGFTTAVWHDAGWINDFFQLNVRDSTTGLMMHGNHINLHGLIAEANVTGVDLITHLDPAEQQSTVNFFGGCIEINSGVGLKIRFAHDLNLFGVYFESNAGGHIMAGTDSTDSIESINIVGGSLHAPNPVTFDRVGRLSIMGQAEHQTTAPLTITDNVRLVNIQSQFLSHYDVNDASTIEAVSISGKNRISDAPWFSTDFSQVTIPTNTPTAVSLDALGGMVTLGPLNATNLSEYTGQFLTGTKSVRCDIQAGKTFAGMTITIATRFLTSDYLCMKIPVYLSTTTDRFRILVQPRYNSISSGLLTSDTFDYVPAPTGNYGSERFNGKWMTFIVPINIAKVKALANYSSLFDIKVHIYGSIPAALGDEWFAIDSMEIYQTKFIANPYGNVKTLRPLQISPSIVNTEYLVQGGKKTWYASVMPTSGSYNQGDYVKNTAPVLQTNGSTLKGWIRLTTGSSHVLSTDWALDLTPASTATTTTTGLSEVLISDPNGLRYVLSANVNGALVTTPKAIAYDFFDRANSTTTLGSSWTAVSGTWGISSNNAYAVSDTNGDLAVWASALATANIRMIMKGNGEYGAGGNYRIPNAVLRYTNSTNFLYVRMESGNVVLGKCLANVFTTLQTVAATTTNGTAYKLTIIADGNNIRVQVDDVDKIDYTLTSGDITAFGTATGIGIRINNTGAPTLPARFDYVMVEPL